MPEDENSQSDLYRIVSAELIKTASAVAGFKLKKPQFASAANVSGIRTVALMFSQRHEVSNESLVGSRPHPEDMCIVVTVAEGIFYRCLRFTDPTES